nr:sugar ABC transporter substrate-binding protein [Maliibacterium massiliense]
MRKSIKWLTCVLALVLICGAMLTGCSNKPAETSPSASTSASASAGTDGEKGKLPDRDLTFAIYLRRLSQAYYKYEHDGAVQAMEDHNKETGRNDKLVVYDHNGDLQREIANVEDSIVTKVDVGIINPIDIVGSNGCIDALVRAGIPVVNIDGESTNSDKCDLVIVSNNREAGRLQMEKLCEKLGGKGNIIMFCDSTNANSKIRYDGAMEELKKYPDIKVLEVYDGETSVEKTLDVMQNFMQSYQEEGIDGVWTFSDTASNGAVSATVGTPLEGKIVITGVNGDAINLGLIRDGKQYGTSAQFPFQLGYQGVMNAFKLMEGETFDEKIYIDVEWVDKDNVQKFIDVAEAQGQKVG